MKLKSVLCLVGFFFLFTVNAHSSMIGDLEIVGEITLSGNDIPFETNSDDGNRHRSITPDIPIIATLCGNNLVEINFFAAVGEVEITITQDVVPVYTSSENITTSILKNIQLSSDVTGAFLIEIKGDNGAYAYGWFNL